MEAYIYQADLLCAECGENTRAWITDHGRAPVGVEDECSYDSDDYPKGPYSAGGGEADSPQHCGHCGIFLENPLTSDGWNYLQEILAEGAAVRARLADAERTGQGAIQRSILAYHEQYQQRYGIAE